jgi:hypothetical protein
MVADPRLHCGKGKTCCIRDREAENLNKSLKNWGAGKIIENGVEMGEVTAHRVISAGLESILTPGFSNADILCSTF